MRRIKEVLESHQWSPDSDGDSGYLADQSLGSEGDAEEDGFHLEVNELEREMMGLRMAIERAGDDDEQSDAGLHVEEMEALTMRIRAIKGMYAYICLKLICFSATN
jgi:hypothetical protein